jgi:hypothetical protein
MGIFSKRKLFRINLLAAGFLSFNRILVLQLAVE